ncbi:Isoflavone reductase family protein [Pleurostoma richardsiae]|uniref:Isoflavone reductase family protein n=1 Tax=Pleurostoma richardsiae TaxID=41990 RepID=A0AA38S434_9PEZI|nr:Isoflavone reductase family protein [Pleurostoma richardsiae]
MEPQSAGPLQAAQVPNTYQRVISTPRGQYLILVSWPLGWNPDGTTDDPNIGDIPVLYMVDGNAYFFTATDVVRRLQFMFGKKAIVIAVGYPVTDSVYAPQRRGPDLTPPSKRERVEPPTGKDGKPQAHVSFGGADEFHGVLEDIIMPVVEQEILPSIPLKTMPRALFGHSFGGLFTLFSLFTRPGLFDTYIAASPSIWWNGCSIVEEQERAFLEGGNGSGEGEPAPSKPRLFMMYGSYEQDVVRKPYESEEEFARRKKHATEFRMKYNAVEMAGRLDTSDKLEELWLQEYEGEDHGSAAVCALQSGILRLLGESAS